MRSKRFEGAAGGDGGSGIALDTPGNVYIAGAAGWAGFPAANGAYLSSPRPRGVVLPPRNRQAGERQGKAPFLIVSGGFVHPTDGILGSDRDAWAGASALIARGGRSEWDGRARLHFLTRASLLNLGEADQKRERGADCDQ